MESEPNPIDPAKEREYNLRIRHPERGPIYEGFAKRSAELRAACPGFKSLRYGASPPCVIDFFAAPGAGAAPLFVFIHGGYWRALDRGIFSFLAEPWLRCGVHAALIGYDLAPAVSVRTIVGEAGVAMDLLRAQAGPLQIDTGRIVISGHSAGAQLGAMQLCAAPGWRAAGYAGVSGVYDLAPLLATSINHDVHLDAGEAHALSPIHQPVSAGTRYICAVGAAETDGFRQQSHAYAAYLRKNHCEAAALELPGRNHFDILDDLADPEHDFFRQTHALLQNVSH